MTFRLLIQQSRPGVCTLLAKYKTTTTASIATPRPFTSSLRSLSFDVSGVFTPIATPFNDNESIAYDKLAENFTRWNTTNLRGYLVEGSNGEFVLMSPEERVHLVAHVRKLIPGNKMLIAGAGCESTSHTTAMCLKMAEAGADAVMVVTPSFFKNSLNDRSLIHHFTSVADQSPVPVLLYSVPANTGVDLSVAAITALSSHANIIGVKDSGGDVTKLATLVHATKGQDFQVLAGSAGYLLGALHVGCVGGVCALANIAPELVCELYLGFQQKIDNRGDLTLLQHRLIGPNTAVTKTYGVAGMKQAMDMAGYYGGPTRKPLMPLVPEAQQHLRNILLDAKLIAI